MTPDKGYFVAWNIGGGVKKIRDMENAAKKMPLALENAHKAIGNYTRLQALRLLEASLDTGRKEASQRGGGPSGTVGIRAALGHKEMVKPRNGDWTKGFVLGDEEYLSRYNPKYGSTPRTPLIRYWRVIERGGGLPPGYAMRGFFLDAQGRFTVAPHLLSVKGRAVKRYALKLNVGASDAGAQTLATHGAIPQKSRDRSSKVKQANAQMKALFPSDIANSPFKRVGKDRGSSLVRSGAPFGGWRGTPGAAAAGFARARGRTDVGGHRGFPLRIQKSIVGKHFMAKAAYNLRTSGIAVEEYKKAFNAQGINFLDIHKTATGRYPAVQRTGRRIGGRASTVDKYRAVGRTHWPSDWHVTGYAGPGPIFAPGPGFPWSPVAPPFPYQLSLGYLTRPAGKAGQHITIVAAPGGTIP